MRQRTQHRVSLEVRVVVGLLFISLVPLAVSAMLIQEIAEVAQNFSSNRVDRLTPHLEASQKVYRQLIDTKKSLYRELARRTAQQPGLNKDAVTPALLEQSTDLLAVELLGPDGEVVAHTEREKPASDITRFRELRMEEPLPGGGQVALTFAADIGLLEEYEALGKELKTGSTIDEVRETLPSSYRTAFLVLVGGVVVLVTTTGIILARRITRRVETLVSGTREIAGGNLQARVVVSGRDELAELANSFNRMVEDLQRERRQILYLQRIGAWQDVARRLAHEIKNPLTPIQLAVQQTVSSYSGDDARHKKQLADMEEIVGEEIDNLRRLVDAFSVLGRLPRVAAAAIDLGEVVGDLVKDPIFRAELEVVPPPAPVTVRADRLLLRRVLANLVENGIQAGQGAGRSGKVVVSWHVAPARGHAVVTVDDEGPGVADDQRERIFEPYVTSKETGTGLGLAIAKKIALEHSGALDVSEEAAPTGGARFLLTIPLGDAPAS